MRKNVFVCLALALVFAAALPALAEEAINNGQAKLAEEALPLQGEEINNGQDITRPLTRFDLRYQFQNAPIVGDQNHDDVHLLTLRVDKPFNLGNGWLFAFRADLPLMMTNRRTLDNLDGDMEFGLADSLVQGLLIKVVNQRFAWAAGTQVIFPTATDDQFGAGKYRVVPTVAARITTDEVLKGSWVALAAQWDTDFAESRSNSTEINELKFAPVVNIPLPNHWFITLFPTPDIRYNMGDVRSIDSGRWFVPADVMVGKMFGRNVVATLEASVPIINDYKVYDFKCEARVGYFF